MQLLKFYQLGTEYNKAQVSFLKTFFSPNYCCTFYRLWSYFDNKVYTVLGDNSIKKVHAW